MRSPPMVFHPQYSIPWPETHRFAMWKFEDLWREATASGLATRFYEPSEAPSEALHRAHDAAYLRAWETDTLPPHLWRRIGFTQRPDHAALVRRTSLEVGGTLLAADLAQTYGLACNLGGGTHHAHRDYGSGYTALNDLAVAALAASGRPLVVDCDVHQGDGTADILKGTHASCFSLHCDANFPFGFSRQAFPHLGGDESDLDVALPAGSGDAEVLAALRRHLPPLLDDLKPTLVLYDAGVDVDKVDALGKFDCTRTGIYVRDLYVIEQCVRRQIPVATVIGGGYDHDRARLAKRHAIVLRAAIHVWRKYRLS
ncbi:hypothetical protein CTAYLR_000983 [Chrysophaeum taylorii]|uniref:Histone deacetylase domain-containing protein n=1 Tax=Chrysophaeum taylorii TaxID=2483200 RepID=A0AAD7UHK1_9STRA|nr:hypothetical protein CTAYLR_000983 [Chrysophaeum taylorii]